MRSRHTLAAAAACLTLLVCSSTASASAACPTDLVIPTAADVAVAATAVVCDVNAIRAKHGLGAVRWNWRLWFGAQRMAGEVVERRFFGHVTPDGRNLIDRARAAGYIPPGPSWSLGENLAWGYGALSSPLSVVMGWMNSPSHRKNVLDPAFDEIGIGVVPGSPIAGKSEGMVYVANFGTRGSKVRTSRRAVRRAR